MELADRQCCDRFGNALLSVLREMKEIAGLPPGLQQAAVLKLFELPEESALLRPGEAAGLSIKERAEDAERLGLVYTRDVAHGRLYRHPIITTWIVCISQSPGDHRSGMNCASELRDGWREARDNLMSALKALDRFKVRDAIRDTEPPASIVAAGKALDVAVAELGETRGARSSFYANVGAFTEAPPRDTVKTCDADCTCLTCEVERLTESMKMNDGTVEGWRLFVAAVRRAQRDTDNRPVLTILKDAGIPELQRGVLATLFRHQVESPLSPCFGEQINVWIEARREAIKLEKDAKKAKYLPRTPQQKAQAWLDAPDATDTTAMSDFLFAVNDMKKAMDSEVQRYRKDLKDAHAIIQDLINATVDTTALDTAKAEVVTARAAAIAAEQQAASATAATARALAAEAALRDLQRGVAKLLAEISSKTESVRALRLTEDLTSITDHLLNGAIALGVDVQSN